MTPSTSERAVVHVVDDLHVGGAQRLVVTFAEEAARRRLPVTVIGLAGERDGAVERDLRELGADVVVLAPRVRGPLGRVAQVLDLARCLRQRRPTVVHTHLTYANVVGGLAARLAGVGAVATLHSTSVGADGNSQRMVRLETACLRRVVGGVIAVGTAVEEAQRGRLGRRRASVIPNAVAVAAPSTAAEISEARHQLSDDHEDYTLLAVGRLVPAKGYGDLLQALAQVRTEVPSARLVIVGDGPARGEIEAAIAQDALTDVVRLLGQREDVRRLMEAADVYVSASRWEGLPLTLLEAMSVGAPVVVTAVGDVATVVDRHSGVVVAPQDPQALARAIVELHRDPAAAARLGVAAQRRILTEFGAPQWVDRLLRIYETVR